MGNGESLFLAVIAIAVLAALGVDAVLFGHGTRVLAVPAGVGSIVVILCVLRTWQARKGGDAGADPVLPATLIETLRMIAGFAAVLPFVLLFGFVIGLPVYAALYLRLRGESWRASAITGMLALAGALLFIELLGMRQPRGPLVWP
jgi:hypothetical protein